MRNYKNLMYTVTTKGASHADAKSTDDVTIAGRSIASALKELIAESGANNAEVELGVNFVARRGEIKGSYLRQAAKGFVAKSVSVNKGGYEKLPALRDKVDFAREIAIQIENEGDKVYNEKCVGETCVKVVLKFNI